MMDADSLYIHVRDHQVSFTERSTDPEQVPELVEMVRELQKSRGALDEAPDVALLSGQAPLRRLAPDGADEGEKGEEYVEETEDDEDEDDEEGDDEEGDDDEETEPDAEGAQRARFVAKAKARYGRESWEALVYGERETRSQRKKPERPGVLRLFDDESDEDEEEEGLDDVDCCRVAQLPHGGWTEEEREELRLNRFLTGAKLPDEESEAGEGADGAEGEAGGEEGAFAKDRAVAKAAKAAGAEPGQADLSAFDEAAQIGHYVRLEVEGLPASCVRAFAWRKPLVVGGLLPGESTLGFQQMRVKKHRWHKKLLKTNDVLLCSAGWRRFQTLPVFSLEDRGGRMRMLKYTPEHMHCFATIYGPIMPPTTGVLLIRNWFDRLKNFRISGTGGVIESASNFRVLKKLKLVGEPYKIFKNTAFIKKMFSSDLEVAKCRHAKIQTVSGLRGEIKKAIGKQGSFRATFEDKILMSDLVMCKSWVDVQPREFYNPMIDDGQWRRMRMLGELRRDEQVAIPHKIDSEYGTKIERGVRKFAPLRVPKTLEKRLPFASRAKVQKQKKLKGMAKARAVVRSDREKEVDGLLNRLNLIRKERAVKKETGKVKKRVAKEKQVAYVQGLRDAVKKDARKKKLAKDGAAEKRKRASMRLD